MKKKLLASLACAGALCLAMPATAMALTVDGTAYTQSGGTESYGLVTEKNCTAVYNTNYYSSTAITDDSPIYEVAWMTDAHAVMEGGWYLSISMSASTVAIDSATGNITNTGSSPVYLRFTTGKSLYDNDVTISVGDNWTLYSHDKTTHSSKGNGYQLAAGATLDIDSLNITIDGVQFHRTSNTNAVYRLYNAATSEHLWTQDLNEYNTLSGLGWTPENVGWTAATYSTVPVYRLYNPVLATHHYTTDSNEVAELTSQHGWVKDNGGQAAFYSASSTASDGKPVCMTGASPIYRLYNGGLSQHHYTASISERDALTANFGWVQEGISFFAYVK